MDYRDYYLGLYRDYYRDPFPPFPPKHQGVVFFSGWKVWAFRIMWHPLHYGGVPP